MNEKTRRAMPAGRVVSNRWTSQGVPLPLVEKLSAS